MTNYEKYRVPSEWRVMFDAFCNSHICESCPCNADVIRKTESEKNAECVFKWLAFEVEEKILPCPCCGGYASLDTGTDWARVKCRVCGLETEKESTKSEAVAKWNRRTDK